jgi:hypothetical protein
MKKLFVIFALLSLVSVARAQTEDMVRANQAVEHAGEYAMVCGVIASTKYLQNSRGAPTYLNFDKPWPDSEFSAVIFGKNRKNFDPAPETLTGYKACVYGKIRVYKGKPQMELVKSMQLSVKPPK